MDDNCELCGKHLHSMTLRRVGDHVYCTEHGDGIVLPFINAMNHKVAKDIKTFFDQHGEADTKEYFCVPTAWTNA